MPAKSSRVLRAISTVLLIGLVLVLVLCPNIAAAGDKNRDLILASMKGNLAEVTRLLDSGADVNAIDELGFPALVRAAGSDYLGRLKLVKLLVDRGADVNAKTKAGWTALMEAALRGHLELIRLLLDRGADVNAKANDGVTALITAAGRGHLEIVKVLLDKGADINAKDASGLSALAEATASDRLEVVKLLRDRGADVDVKSARGGSAPTTDKSADVRAGSAVEETGPKGDKNRELLGAVFRGDLGETTRLLDSGADPNAKDEFGWTALIRAAESGRTEVAKLLVDRGADVNAKTKAGRTALMDAAERDHVDVVKLLLEKGADFNAKDKQGLTALMSAAGKGALDVVRLLLDKGADVNAKDAAGRTALMGASSWPRNLETVQVLLDKGADVNGKDNEGRSALLEAAEPGRSNVVKLLKQWGAEITLGVAATLGDVEEVQRLIEKGATVDPKAKDGRIALMNAVKQRNQKVVKLLLDKGADVNATEEGSEALAIAAREGYKEIENLLKAYGAQTREALKIGKFADKVARRGTELFFRLRDGRIVSTRDTSSHEWSGYPVGYAFHDFIDPWYVINEHYYESYGTQFINRDTGAVKIVYGDSSFSPDNTGFLARGYPGESPCDAEIWRLSPTNIMREWISEGHCFYSYQWSGPSTVEVADSSGNEMIARVKHDDGKWRCSGSSDICKSVDDKPPSDSKAPGKGKSKFGSGSTGLTKAAAEGYLDRVRKLLDNGADVNAKDNHGRTALAEAARKGHLEMAKMLLDRGADINAEGWAGRTALMCAAERGHREVAKLLIERGAKPTLLDAAALGDAEEMERLVTGGADVNANYKDGDTAPDGKAALFWAARAGRWDAVKLLLANGADLNSDADFGRRALLEASKDGHLGAVKDLLEKRVDINAKEDSGWTPLIAAAGEGRLEVVKLLLERGADINAKDKPGRTALMNAAIRGQSKVVKLLLDKGAEVNAKDEGGWTALVDAAWGGNAQVVRLLLGKSADVNASTERGETALLIAAVSGHAEIVKLLLTAGADINAKPKFGKTALKIAQEKGYKEIEELLKARGAKE